jgi:hypothetical protein
MNALNKLQRTMLRGWAINMTLALRYSRTRWFGFDYTAAEETRSHQLHPGGLLFAG